MKRRFSFLVFCLAIAMVVPSLFAQANNSYQQTNLVSDQPGVAAHTDPNLVNAWGLSFFPNDPFWISNNGTGTTTIYDGTGTTQLPVVTIPPPHNSTATSTPTGQVANTVNDFPVAGVTPFFLFDTEDGTISAWTGGANATLVVDNSATGAVYKGLTIGTNATGNFLLAANFSQGRIDIFDKNYAPASLAGNFTDPTLPAGYAPFNLRAIGNRVVVTYALQDATKAGDVAGAGNGFVDLYDTDGHLITRLVSQGSLNSPWGIASAPATFGAFANDLLIGNFGDGRINAFDPATGNLVGTLNDQNAQPLVIDGLWALSFGGGGPAGDPNKLYFTAGPAGETHGLFGSLAVFTATTAGGDFTLGVGQQSLTVVRGGSSTLQVDVTGTGGFTGPVNLSCSGLPTGASCVFTQPSIVAGGTQAQTTVMVSVASTYVAPYSVAGIHPAHGSRTLAFLTTFGMGAFGCVLFGTTWRRTRVLGLLALSLVAFVLMAQTACGGGSSSNKNTGGTANSFPMTVTGTAGALTHSSTVTVTVQ
jgi:uncharacterized protein (TIGR03118 family)